MKRSKTIIFRVSQSERSVVQALAAREDRRLSEYLRELVRRDAQGKGLSLQAQGGAENEVHE